jgi:hypothetical protein
MIFVITADIGWLEKAIDIYYRCGAENAKEGDQDDTFLQKI